jgi:hypothetical protein
MKFSIPTSFLFFALPLMARAAIQSDFQPELAPETGLDSVRNLSDEGTIEVNLDVGPTSDEIKVLFLKDMEAGVLKTDGVDPDKDDAEGSETIEVNLDVGPTSDEIKALFLKDMEAGVLETDGLDPDKDDAEGSDQPGLRGRKLQSSSYWTNYVLLCKNSDCQGGHVWARAGGPQHALANWE